ncbi:MAG: hypothetical protein R3F49_17460 [Planctomycetota bacterium]
MTIYTTDGRLRSTTMPQSGHCAASRWAAELAVLHDRERRRDGRDLDEPAADSDGRRRRSPGGCATCSCIDHERDYEKLLFAAWKLHFADELDAKRQDLIRRLAN